MKEATYVSCIKNNVYVYFNPRLREGGDLLWHWFHFLISISIHASAKEATLILLLLFYMLHISIHASAKEATMTNIIFGRVSIFQSTPPRRRRLNLFFFYISQLKFQSTPPRRRRRCVEIRGLLLWNFNPRLREGGDYLPFLGKFLISISIHASAKEATLTHLG